MGIKRRRELVYIYSPTDGDTYNIMGNQTKSKQKIIFLFRNPDKY